ncbi:MAG: hypothetical protein JW741_06825 [Sedimentisphaerales bacterium]|nr:hypothetical protein [Sedimentisphaerales bacterium]
MSKHVVFGVVAFGVFVFGACAIANEKHLVPADKGLSKEYLQKLRARGERAVYAGDDLETIGMPVGGIAAGQLYLRGDGTLGLWQIFNKHVFTGYGRDCYRTYRPDSPVDSGFAVAVESDGKPLTRVLDKDFGTVEFAGEYPIGLVRYQADDFPVAVEMEAFSPFIPLNAKDSALPATLFHLTLKNTSEKTVTASVLGWLENAVCFHSAKAINANRRTRILDERGRTLVVHTAEKAPPPKETAAPREKIILMDFEGDDYHPWQAMGEAFGKQPARGTLSGQQKVSGFQGQGLANTFLGGDGPHGTLTSPTFQINRKYINFLIGGGNQVEKTCINLLIDGKVVRSAVGKDNERLEWHFWSIADFEGKQAQMQIVDNASGGWGHINVDQIELSDVARSGLTGPLEELPDYGSMVLASARKGNVAADRRLIPPRFAPSDIDFHAEANAVYPAVREKAGVVLAPAVEIEPNAERTFVFVLSWFFPNHDQGREYANRFADAAQVAHYVLDNHDRLAGGTEKWHRTFYEDSTLPRWLLFRLHSTVANLATGTCQWWGNGRFWAWEGVGCCPGTCTHVWNYAHAPGRLFPELERSAREMQDFGEGFHSDSGLVGFRSNHAYAADGQCGTVLKAYREHQCAPDDSFLRRTWPRVRKTLEFSIGQDGNEDGLIEASQHNTFDINFEGPNTFVGSLYLAALRAGEEMAREMGDEPFAERCRRIFESGRKLTIERLWNGEYFIQRVDLEKHPKYQYGKGCLSDQLFGQGWAHQLGLGYIYLQQNVQDALGSVWKYNWTPDVGPYNDVHTPERWFALPGEPGLFTCTWPKSDYMAQGVRYKSEIWTGIEYQVAGHMVWEDMLDEGLAICHGIEQRYHPAAHNPFNEVECGDHYARAMASWGVYTALAGFEYHGPKGHIGFAPRMEPRDFQAAFTGAEGWGTFAQKRTRNTQSEQIELRWGHLNVKTLAFSVPRRWKSVGATVRCSDRTVESTSTLQGTRVEITLTDKTRLLAGQKLVVEIRRTQK